MVRKLPMIPPSIGCWGSAYLDFIGSCWGHLKMLIRMGPYELECLDWIITVSIRRELDWVWRSRRLESKSTILEQRVHRTFPSRLPNLKLVSIWSRQECHFIAIPLVSRFESYRHPAEIIWEFIRLLDFSVLDPGYFAMRVWLMFPLWLLAVWSRGFRELFLQAQNTFSSIMRACRPSRVYGERW